MKDNHVLFFREGAKVSLYMMCLLLLSYAMPVKAQSEVSKILSDITKNNKTLQSQSRYWEARKIEFKTANNLYDPTVSFDYMRGSPQLTAGNETDINVIQRFDFPTVYGKRRTLAEEQGKQADYVMVDERQKILLEAKTICIELVYRNKLQEQLNERKAKTEKYLSDFQTRLEKGEGNVLDVNKTKLQLIEINKEYQLNISTINQLNQQLTSLNGGVETVFNGTEYPMETVVDFNLLISEIEGNDPVRKLLEQQQVISRKQIDVTRAMSLPKFDVGYHQQKNIGGNFYGARIGMSIPLWENKNRVQQRQMELSTVDLALDDHKNNFFYEIRQLYEAYTNLNTTLQEYRTALASLNSIELLDKALRLGEITTIEYFLEVNYFYQATNNYLMTERELNEVIAKIYKFQL